MERNAILEAIKQEQDKLSKQLRVSGQYHDLIDGMYSFLEVLRETDPDYQARKDKLLNTISHLEIKVARRANATNWFLNQINTLTQQLGPES